MNNFAAVLVRLTWLAWATLLAEASPRGPVKPKLFAFDLAVLFAGIVLWVVAVRYRKRHDAEG